jgi:hypothetical protein
MLNWGRQILKRKEFMNLKQWQTSMFAELSWCRPSIDCRLRCLLPLQTRPLLRRKMELIRKNIISKNANEDWQLMQSLQRVPVLPSLPFKEIISSCLTAKGSSKAKTDFWPIVIIIGFSITVWCVWIVMFPVARNYIQQLCISTAQTQ